ncbi:hypothetical protein GGQ85_001863 [Nitrobacter vulgaris]|nr:hypothetical protein [Nitrobacter vulgaris]
MSRAACYSAASFLVVIKAAPATDLILELANL